MGRYHIFNYSDKDIEFCPKNGHFSNYRNFLLKEFFDSNNEEMDTIMFTYRNRFGDSAYQHVMRNYYSNWRNGDKTLTNIQKDRILSIMPALLNKNAINLLDAKKSQARYEQGIEDVENGIRNSVQSFFKVQENIYSSKINLTIVEIIEIFHSEIKRVNELKLMERVFVLNEFEKEEIIQTSKYIINIKLQNQISQIKNDFNIISNLIESFNLDSFISKYKITAFGVTIDLNETQFYNIKLPEIFSERPINSSRFKEYIDKYLVTELVNANNDLNRAEYDSFLNLNDIQLFFNYNSQFSNSKSEIKIHSTFKSHGGILTFESLEAPLKLSRKPIIISSIKLTTYIVSIIFIVSLAINFNDSLLYLYLMCFCIFIILKFIEETLNFKYLIIEFKNYLKDLKKSNQNKNKLY